MLPPISPPVLDVILSLLEVFQKRYINSFRSLNDPIFINNAMRISLQYWLDQCKLHIRMDDDSELVKDRIEALVNVLELPYHVIL
jgi:hypothetical protein